VVAVQDGYLSPPPQTAQPQGQQLPGADGGLNVLHGPLTVHSPASERRAGATHRLRATVATAQAKRPVSRVVSLQVSRPRDYWSGSTASRRPSRGPTSNPHVPNRPPGRRFPGRSAGA
jgi:hypothetical protein